MMALGITIGLVDQFTGKVGGILKDVEKVGDKIRNVSGVLAGAGAVVTGFGMYSRSAITTVGSAFADLEDASTRLKSTMMGADGAAGAFEEVNALAIRLGDLLPGTTADFLQMMSALKSQGISDESILGGVGEATAKMAVLLKKTPSEMAVFAAQLKTALGVADGEMLQFMDTIQRTYFMGVDATQMMYAFGRSGGALKTLGLQGLEAGRALAPLYAMWIKGGVSGETVGTSFATMTSALLDRKKIKGLNEGLSKWGIGPLKFTDDKGNFAGVENMIEQFDKLKGLDSTRLNTALKFVFGGGQDQAMAATMVKNGVEGYRKQVAAMKAQADLARRVGAVLGTLTNLWEAATGTFTNVLAGVGEAMSDDMKFLIESFGSLAEYLGGIVKDNPEVVKWIGRLALALTAVALVVGPILLGLGTLGGLLVSIAAGWGVLAPIITAAGVALTGLAAVIKGVGLAMLANPITLILMGIVAAVMALAYAAKLIHDNWEPIMQWFSDAWSATVGHFLGEAEKVKAEWNALVTWIGEKIQAIKDMMPDLSGMVPDWMKKVSGEGEAAQRRTQGEWFGPDSASGMFGPDIPTTTSSRSETQVGGDIRRMFGPDIPLTPPPRQETQVGGDIRIHLDQDGRVNSIRAITNNPRVPLEVDTGAYMGY
jgi:TP901 family phage tail tape measure protein